MLGHDSDDWHATNVFLVRTWKDTVSYVFSRYRPNAFHRTAFTDTGLLNGFLFSFPINLLVLFVLINGVGR